MNGLVESVVSNVVFVVEFLAVVASMFVVAVVIEKLALRKQGVKSKMFTTRKLAMIGMFSAIATVLYLFDFPVPFAPPFYKIDFSELPVLVATFAFGPVAGVMTEFCKVVLKIVFKGTTTAFVGDLANFAVGCSLILPASIVYQFMKTKKGAIIGCIAGTLCMTVFGTAFNGIYLLPKFAELYGMPLESLVAMGTEVNRSITNVTTFVCFAVAPLNLLKGSVISLITMLVYKPLSPIIKEGRKH